MSDLLKTKISIYEACQAHMKEAIESAKKRMDDAQNAANNETKSSVGDKYETGRAMAQRERDKAAGMLAESAKLQQVLDEIDPEISSSEVKLGSLVITNKGSFLISIAIGKIEVNGSLYFAVSPVSPIGKLLKGEKAGEEIKLNGNVFEIKALA